MTQELVGQTKLEQPETGSFLRRNNRGCKSKDFYNWPEQPFDDMDSPLAVQQYIQQLIRRDPSDVDEILKLPEGQDIGAWKIEHLRQFCMQLNGLATKLQECCFPRTCNQMTATEQWIFLCAAHKQPNECPAIDYTRHTLDGAASLLNSNKYFPSRVTIKESSVAKLGSVCRRVYRIFSHAYYHHFQVFDEFERDTHLCRRFSKFVTINELMSKDSLIVPSDGSKPEVELGATNTSTEMDTTIASNPNDDNAKQEVTTNDDGEGRPSMQVKQISTNTMVKGASAAASLTQVIQSNPEEASAAKSIDGDSISPSSTSSTTENLNQVESEA